MFRIRSSVWPAVDSYPGHAHPQFAGPAAIQPVPRPHLQPHPPVHPQMQPQALALQQPLQQPPAPLQAHPPAQPRPLPAQQHAQAPHHNVGPTGPTGPQGLQGDSIEGVGISQVLFEGGILSILLTDGTEYGFEIPQLVGPTGPPGPPGPAANINTDLLWHKLGELEYKVQHLMSTSKQLGKNTEEADAEKPGENDVE